jgi:hypothetical protein
VAASCCRGSTGNLGASGHGAQRRLDLHQRHALPVDLQQAILATQDQHRPVRQHTRDVASVEEPAAIAARIVWEAGGIDAAVDPVAKRVIA